MSILDNARYTEMGKRAEARKLADSAVAAVAPHIEKEAVRKYAPVIQEQTAREIFDQLGGGLAAYASNDGITVPQGVNVTNEEMQRAYQFYGHTPNMKNIQDMRILNTLHNIDGGTISNVPADGLSNLNIRKG